MKRKVCSVGAAILVALLLFACSLPPLEPVTRRDLMQTRIYNRFVVEESPEELLYALNTRGEVVIEGIRTIGDKKYPVYIKLLATVDGVELLEYDR